MSDLIRREDVARFIRDKVNLGQWMQRSVWGADDASWSLCDRIINEVPSARKTGHWVRVGGYCTPGGDPVWKCSECGKGMHVYGIEHGTYGAEVSDGQWVACPNCGAEMRGEEE